MIELNIRDFTDTVQMEMVVEDIRRYQTEYMRVKGNGKGILVRWKKGWFAVGNKGTSIKFVRPTEFRNMTDELKKRLAHD